MKGNNITYSTGELSESISVKFLKHCMAYGKHYISLSYNTV